MGSGQVLPSMATDVVNCYWLTSAITFGPAWGCNRAPPGRTMPRGVPTLGQHSTLAHD